MLSGRRTICCQASVNRNIFNIIFLKQQLIVFHHANHDLKIKISTHGFTCNFSTQLTDLEVENAIFQDPTVDPISPMEDTRTSSVQTVRGESVLTAGSHRDGRSQFALSSDRWPTPAEWISMPTWCPKGVGSSHENDQELIDAYI